MTHLIDTHAHLFWDSFKEDFEETVKRATAAGVDTVVNVGVSVDLSRIAAEQAKEQSRPDFRMYSAIAIHPEEAIKYFNNEAQLKNDVAELEKIYLNNKEIVIGVGECGLDFAYFNREGYLPEGLTIEKAKELQKQLLQAQIDLAKKYDLPLLIHCRDDRSRNSQNTECWDEVVELTHDYKGIYHCYSGLPLTTENILKNTKFYISFAGNLTYPKNDYLKEAANLVPLDRILLETDCPFLPPQSIRGKRNEPSSVKEIAQLIAQIKNTSVEEVAEVTTGNFQKLFNLTNLQT